MPKSNAPVILLVRPQLGENIGAVARAMANFGLSELRLVAPRDGWPNPRAFEVSSGAEFILEKARVFPDFRSAISDLTMTYATTARGRDMEKPVLTAGVAMEEIIPQGNKVALVFGPERTGLENDEITLCDRLITIPTAPEHSSLNLAQSVVVLGYEWFRNEGRGSRGDKNISRPSPLAPKSDYLGLFDQLETYLDQTNYYRVDHKKPIMWQNLQTMLMRGMWSEQEIRSFRGMLRAIWERRRRNSSQEEADDFSSDARAAR